MQFNEFNPISQIQPGAFVDQTISVNFDSKPEAVKFTVWYAVMYSDILFSLEKYTYSVTLFPSIGELVVPALITISDFVKLQRLIVIIIYLKLYK